MIKDILIMWIIYALYMEILVRRRGPVGGLFFYPQVVQDRVLNLGLITKEEYKKRKTFAYILLIVLMILVPTMIIYVRGTRDYLGIVKEFYILFIGAEIYDWLFIDTIWVALSDWWIIPGTEDLLDTWHDIRIKKWKIPKLIILGIPVSFLIGGLVYGILLLV